jgi:ribosome-associated toxin RatA of RatAB toxin-antitoxin module
VRRGLRVVLGLIALLACGVAHAQLEEVSFTEADRARLARGEAVVTRRQPADGKGIAAQVAMVIEGTPEEVWAVVNDCAHFKDFMPRTKISEEKAIEPGHSTCKVQIAVPFPLADLWSETDVHAQRLPNGAYRRTMDLRSGSYRKLHAAWDVLPQEQPGRALAVYRIEADPETSVPDRLLRIGQESSLPDTLRAVQKRVNDVRAAAAPPAK